MHAADRLSATVARPFWQSLPLGLVVAAVFIVLAITRLDAQGLHYDELHQAAPAFAYLGQPPQAFSALKVGNIPILNQRYSGALKTAMYGLYLRFTGAGFSVLDWRLIGILVVAAGLLASAVVLLRHLPLPALIAFYALLLSDQSVLLITRFDWGPVALALFGRLIFIATWIGSEMSGRPSLRSSALLGGMVGLSVFEKLSNVVLVIPLVVLLVLGGSRRTWRHAGAMIAGLVVGALPLALANLYTLLSRGVFISWQFDPIAPVYTAGAFLDFLREYLSLGVADNFRKFVLGPSQPGAGTTELWLVSIQLLTVTAAATLPARHTPAGRAARTMLLSYLGLAVGIYLLPARTWAHHWLVGTPFQYAAIALALCALWEYQRQAPILSRLSLPRLAAACLVAFLVFRLVALSSLERSLLRGDASLAWDPSLTRLGEFAAAKSNEAVFVAADWGVGTQMICFVNGTPGIIMETGWPWDWDAATLKRTVEFVQRSGRSQFYVVFSEPSYFVPLELRSQIIAELDAAFAEEWSRQPLEPEASSLTAAALFKYAMDRPLLPAVQSPAVSP